MPCHFIFSELERRLKTILFSSSGFIKRRKIQRSSKFVSSDPNENFLAGRSGTVDQLAGIARINRQIANISPITCISLVDDKEDDISPDPLETHNEGASPKKKRKTANHKSNRNAIVNFVARNRGKCKETSDSCDAMQFYVINYHAKGIVKTFECHLCERLRLGKVGLQRHIYSVHTGLKPFKCPNQKCLKMLSSRCSGKRNFESVHLHLRPFKCLHRFPFWCLVIYYELHFAFNLVSSFIYFAHVTYMNCCNK